MMMPAPNKPAHASLLFWTALLSFVCGALTVFADYSAIAPHGSDRLLALTPVFGLPVLACMVVGPCYVVLCLAQRRRSQALRCLAACILFCVVIIGAARIGGRLRIKAFGALAQRSMVLVDAIRAYERKYGRPPGDLHELIPEFLAAVPTTGMHAYPQYEYLVPADGERSGNPWVLSVSTPSGFLNFDRFVYYPLQNYPQDVDGNPLERVSEWAYLHE
jgi:hypothetical protein